MSSLSCASLELASLDVALQYVVVTHLHFPWHTHTGRTYELGKSSFVAVVVVPVFEIVSFRYYTTVL